MSGAAVPLLLPRLSSVAPQLSSVALSPSSVALSPPAQAQYTEPVAQALTQTPVKGLNFTNKNGFGALEWLVVLLITFLVICPFIAGMIVLIYHSVVERGLDAKEGGYIFLSVWAGLAAFIVLLFMAARISTSFKKLLANIGGGRDVDLDAVWKYQITGPALPSIKRVKVL
jgi:hypothetical protein